MNASGEFVKYFAKRSKEASYSLTLLCNGERLRLEAELKHDPKIGDKLVFTNATYTVTNVRTARCSNCYTLTVEKTV